MTLDQGAPSDRELIARIADGDRGALHTLFTRHQPWLTARVRRRCADPAVVAEVVNDTFLVVWRQPRKYKGDGSTGWASRPRRNQRRARLWDNGAAAHLSAARHGAAAS